MTPKEKHLYCPPVSRDGMTCEEKLTMIKLLAESEKNPDRLKVLVKYYSEKEK